MLTRYLQQHKTRRTFFQLSASALLSSFLPRSFGQSASASHLILDSTSVAAAEMAVERLLGPHSKQIHLRLSPHNAVESFHISGTPGKVSVEGSTQSSLLMGVNWYLKYVAGASTSWNGDCLNLLPATLPAPDTPITQQANARHRFALNDTNDGYTGPYWSWEQWERQIDILALHGINEVLVYIGAEAVYQQTFRKFHFSDQELRNWFPTPAHQPWWLLQNMSSWVGPNISQQLVNARLDLAAKITRRLRELGMTPVLPGYFGIVPDGFVAKNPNARVVQKGTWLGMKRPDWLDPTCNLFPQVAAEYYRTQEKLLGFSSMFKMDPLHEGGQAGGVNITSAAKSIDEQLQKAHPGAIWAILGWQENPKEELLAGITDRTRMLILDGLSDRYAYADPEKKWDHTPYAFGTIWNFGGHTSIGANVGVWNDRYFDQLTKPDSKLNGIAVMPEASCNNPAAFAFFTELAWRQQRPDISLWFKEWSVYRYGGKDANADHVWDTLRSTAYDGKSGKWSESHDNLFAAQPSLVVRSACEFSPQEPRYDLAVFAGAIGSLLQVHPSLRASSAYRYDLVDVARQTISNNSRLLLPQIRAAHDAADLPLFRKLTNRWLEQISLLERIVGTEPAFLLGSWLDSAKSAARIPAEQAQLEFDARSILLEWGPLSSRDSGVHDYANREWHGLLGFYRERWATYFSMLNASLEKREPVTEIDWFAINLTWSKRTEDYPTQPQGDAYEVTSEVISTFHSSSE